MKKRDPSWWKGRRMVPSSVLRCTSTRNVHHVNSHWFSYQRELSSAASLSTRSSMTSLRGRSRPPAPPPLPTSPWCSSSCPNAAAPVFTGTSGALRGSNPGAILRSASRFLRSFSSSRARRCASCRPSSAAIDVRRPDSTLSMCASRVNG